MNPNNTDAMAYAKANEARKLKDRNDDDDDKDSKSGPDPKKRKITQGSKSGVATPSKKAAKTSNKQKRPPRPKDTIAAMKAQRAKLGGGAKPAGDDTLSTDDSNDDEEQESKSWSKSLGVIVEDLRSGRVLVTDRLNELGNLTSVKVDGNSMTVYDALVIIISKMSQDGQFVS